MELQWLPNGSSGPAAQIVDNYLERLRKGLRGIPARDQEDLVKEIHSHIYEAYRADPTADDVARVLKVLDKLGEPAEVISARMPEVMISVGKKKLPLLILAGLLIAFFGVPLGLSGIGFVASVIIGVLGFIVAFYILAFSMILTGWLTAVVLIIRLIVPTFLDPWDGHLPARPRSDVQGTGPGRCSEPPTKFSGLRDSRRQSGPARR